MLNSDPNANLNHEVPVTPTKPEPSKNFQNLISKLLPDLTITCFQIKQKNFQAIGELEDLCFEERGRTENAAKEKLAKKILQLLTKNQPKKESIQVDQKVEIDVKPDVEIASEPTAVVIFNAQI